MRQRLFESGAEVVASSPAELTAEMKTEMAIAGKLMKNIGITAR